MMPLFASIILPAKSGISKTAFPHCGERWFIATQCKCQSMCPCPAALMPSGQASWLWMLWPHLRALPLVVKLGITLACYFQARAISFLFYNAVFCLVVLFLAGTIMPVEEARCPGGIFCPTSVVRGHAKLLKYPPGTSELRHREVSEMKEKATGPCKFAGVIHQRCKDASYIAVYRQNEGHFTKVALSVQRETLLASLKSYARKMSQGNNPPALILACSVLASWMGEPI